MSTANFMPMLDNNSVTEIACTPTARMGLILVESGRLAADKIDRISQFQQADGSLFGEAAVKLGLVTKRDVEFALSRQFDFNTLVKGESSISFELLAAYHPTAPEVDTLRRLRNALLSRATDFSMEAHVLAIISAHQGEGRSILTANLATVFAQFGRRTLIIDADLRTPRQHALFGVANRTGLSNILAGRASNDCRQYVQGLKNLAVLTAGVRPPNPEELLGRPTFRRLLHDFSRQFDVILIDTPPLELHCDAQTVAAMAGNALLVVRNNVGKAAVIRRIMKDFDDAKINMIGSVLNSFSHTAR